VAKTTTGNGNRVRVQWRIQVTAIGGAEAFFFLFFFSLHFLLI
jgi:hypothetical protein